MAVVNHRFTLASRPVGMPKRTDFAYEEETVRELREGELLIRVLFISLDPAMRGWMKESRSYVPPVGIGELMRALALGQVVASKNSLFAVGKHVSGNFGVQQYFVSEGKGLIEVDPRVAPLPTFLNILGMTGMTAYFGLLETGQPQPGDTVVVSSAGGAVGGVVGQIAKIKGCKAIGIAGGIVLFLIGIRMVFPPADGGGIFGKAGEGEPFIVPIVSYFRSFMTCARRSFAKMKSRA